MALDTYRKRERVAWSSCPTEELAAKLGVSSEHLYGALLITGFLMLVAIWIGVLIWFRKKANLKLLGPRTCR